MNQIIASQEWMKGKTRERERLDEQTIEPPHLYWGNGIVSSCVCMLPLFFASISNLSIHLHPRIGRWENGSDHLNMRFPANFARNQWMKSTDWHVDPHPLGRHRSIRTCRRQRPQRHRRRRKCRPWRKQGLWRRGLKERVKPNTMCDIAFQHMIYLHVYNRVYSKL